MSTADRTRAVLFDIDGTLVDSNYLHVDAWQRALAEQGVHADAWRIHRAIGQDAARLVASLAGDRDDAWIERVTRSHASHYRELAPRLRAFDGVAQLLQTVSALGIRVVLATSAPGGELELLLEALAAARSAVHATTSAEDVDRAKPDPALIDVALQRAGVEPSEAVLVGDSTWDMIAAGRAGVVAFGLRSGGTSSAELTDAGARAVYDDPADLERHLGDVLVD